jgi:hypothetical protein
MGKTEQKIRAVVGDMKNKTIEKEQAAASVGIAGTIVHATRFVLLVLMCARTHNRFATQLHCNSAGS